MKLRFITDKKRHLICVPYSLLNLHKMAEILEIKRCWFHKNHYDIPKGRINEIEKKCEIVSPKEIVEIIKSPQYAEIIIGEQLSVFGASPKDNFWQTQIEYNG